jgi:hypothetical protein
MAKQSLHLQHATLWSIDAVLVVATITAASTHAQQPPPLPHEFYGSVVVKCQPAPVGATIEARGTNVKIGIPGNPITTTQLGKYGGPTAFDPPRLAVQGNLTNVSPIEFYVNGVKAECAVPGGGDGRAATHFSPRRSRN